MKKTLWLLVLMGAMGTFAQQPPSASVGDRSLAAGGRPAMDVKSPAEVFQTPTASDLYCAGFLSEKRLPDRQFVAGGPESPASTCFSGLDLIYLAGGGYQADARYTIVRELQDPNPHEVYTGQRQSVAAAGRPYAELARVRVIDVRASMAVAQVEFSCDAIAPGDVAIPFVEKPGLAAHRPARFDRFAPEAGKSRGQIILARDLDSLLGTGAKVYLNLGADQGVRVGDYFRAVREARAMLTDPVDSLSFQAPNGDDTQKHPPSVEAGWLTPSRGPRIYMEQFPRRAVGELVIVGVTPTSATAMVVFALEDVHVGDTIERDETAGQPQ